MNTASKTCCKILIPSSSTRKLISCMSLFKHNVQSNFRMAKHILELTLVKIFLYSCSIEETVKCNRLAINGRDVLNPPRLQNTSFAGVLKNSCVSCKDSMQFADFTEARIDCSLPSLKNMQF